LNIEIASAKTMMLGTIGAANGYGLVLTLSIISGIYLFNKLNRKKGRIFIVFLIILQFTALILNRSRGALLILICLLICWLYYHRKVVFKNVRLLFLQNHFVYIFVFIGILIIVTAILFFIDRESSMGRILAWRISLPMFYKNPLFGVGYNNFAIEFLNYQALFFQEKSNLSLACKAANLKQAHCEYLQAFCETGFVGGLLFILIIIIPIYQLYKDRHNDNGTFYILLILLGIALHSLIDTPLHVMTILVISYILFGFSPFSKFTLHIKSKILSFILLLLSIILFVFLGYKTLMQYPAYHSWQRGYDCIENRNLDCAISNYEQALKSLPDKGELLFHLGAAQVLEGKYSGGIALLKKSLSNFNDRNIYLSLSYAYLRLHQLSEAENFAVKALSMFPDHLAPHLLLGEIYYYKGDFKKSKASLKKCIYRDTFIKSQDVEIIARDAAVLWKNFYE
jgi:tetratricopeptide (TPR) repeat protein